MTGPSFVEQAMVLTTTMTEPVATDDPRDGPQRVTALYDAHVGEVYRYVHRLCLDHSLAEDVTQDVFVAALREGATDITVGWLFRSARNRLIDIVRRDSAYRDKLVMFRRDQDGSFDGLGQVVETMAMAEALAALRPEHRIVLMLHYVEDLTVAQLAEQVGRSYKGAEGLLSRARAALRTELGGSFDE